MEAEVEKEKDESNREPNEEHKSNIEKSDASAIMERSRGEEDKSRAMRIDAGLSRNVSVGEKVLLREEFSADLYLSYRLKILEAWNRLRTCKSTPNEKTKIEIEDVDFGGSERAKERLQKSFDILSQLGAINSGAIELPEKDISDGNKPSVVVIGAGPAGLTCSRHLCMHGIDVLVLEARDRIGGRVWTDSTSLSAPVDLGAMLITGVEADGLKGLRSDPSSLICRQLGINLHQFGQSCPIMDGRPGRGGTVSALVDQQAEAAFNSIMDEVAKQVEETKANGGKELPLGTVFEECLFKYLTELDLTEIDDFELHESLLRWHMINLEYGCSNSLDTLSSWNWNQDEAYGGFGGPHCLVCGGYSQVTEALGSGIDIRTNKVATKIVVQNSNEMNADDSTEDATERTRSLKHCRVQCDDGSSFFADYVVCTIPLGCLKDGQIKFEPELPVWKQAAISRLEFGPLNKVFLEFDMPFWDDEVDFFGVSAAFCPDNSRKPENAEATNKTDNGGNDTAIQPEAESNILGANGSNSDSRDVGDIDMSGHGFMFWNMHKSLAKPILCGLISGDAANRMDEEWIEDHNQACQNAVENAMKALRRAFQVFIQVLLLKLDGLRIMVDPKLLSRGQGRVQVPPPAASLCVSWKNEKFSRGAYSSVGVGGSGADYDTLSAPVVDVRGKPRVLFAGEHTCKEHPDTVGGAMLSGHREAARILSLSAGHDLVSAAACANVAGLYAKTPCLISSADTCHVVKDCPGGVVEDVQQQEDPESEDSDYDSDGSDDSMRIKSGQNAKKSGDKKDRKTRGRGKARRKSDDFNPYSREVDSALLEQAKKEVNNLLIIVASCPLDERGNVLWNELRSLESDPGRQLAIDELYKIYSVSSTEDRTTAFQNLPEEVLIDFVQNGRGPSSIDMILSLIKFLKLLVEHDRVLGMVLLESELGKLISTDLTKRKDVRTQLSAKRLINTVKGLDEEVLENRDSHRKNEERRKELEREILESINVNMDPKYMEAKRKAEAAKAEAESALDIAFRESMSTGEELDLPELEDFEDFGKGTTSTTSSSFKTKKDKNGHATAKSQKESRKSKVRNTSSASKTEIWKIKARKYAEWKKALQESKRRKMHKSYIKNEKANLTEKRSQTDSPTNQHAKKAKHDGLAVARNDDHGKEKAKRKGHEAKKGTSFDGSKIKEVKSCHLWKPVRSYVEKCCKRLTNVDLHSISTGIDKCVYKVLISSASVKDRGELITKEVFLSEKRCAKIKAMVADYLKQTNRLTKAKSKGTTS